MSNGVLAAEAPAPEPSELSQPTKESDLLRTLGGQTGSESPQAVETVGPPLICRPLLTRYDLELVTPLGFSASSVASAIAAHQYWLSGFGWEGPVGVTAVLGSSVVFVDRDPAASPQLVCVDAVEIAATLVISPGAAAPISVEVFLYADASDHFAGQAWLEAAALEGAFAEAAAGADVVVAVENLGEGTRLWFYRRVGDNRELIGRLVPVP